MTHILMIDTGNTAWMLTSTMLVLLMSIPGIALFYGGLVRQKNVLSIIMQTIFLVAVVSILWVAVGYSWVFDTSFEEKGNPLSFLIGGFGKVFMNGISLDTAAAGNIPELLFAMFLTQFQDNEIVNKMFSAIRPAVVALIAVPVFSLAKGAKVSMKNVWIPVATAILIWGFSLSPIYIIIAAIIAGIAVAYYGIRTGRAAAKQERQMQEKHNDTVAEDKQ